MWTRVNNPHACIHCPNRYFGRRGGGIFTLNRAGLHPSRRPTGEGTAHPTCVRFTDGCFADKYLLSVKWEDGSLLEIRWRWHGERLLLTNHTGKVNPLQRLPD